MPYPLEISGQYPVLRVTESRLFNISSSCSMSNSSASLASAQRPYTLQQKARRDSLKPRSILDASFAHKQELRIFQMFLHQLGRHITIASFDRFHDRLVEGERVLEFDEL